MERGKEKTKGGGKKRQWEQSGIEEEGRKRGRKRKIKRKRENIVYNILIKLTLLTL